MSARNRELLTLLLAGLVASTAFASAWIADAAQIDQGWLPYAALLAGIFLAAHLVARVIVPEADPTLLPLAALLCAIGLVFVYRIDADDGRRQLVWVGGRRPRVRARARLAPVRLPRPRALQVRLRRLGDRAADAAVRPGARHPGQRREALGRHRPAPLPAGRDREDLPRHLPRGLPARQARGARPRPAEGLRPAPRDLGRRDARPRPDERPRLGPPQLRDLPRDAVRRHRADLVRPRRPGAVRGRRRGALQRARPSPAASHGLARAVDGRQGLLHDQRGARVPPELRLVPARQEPLLDRERRVRRHGHRPRDVRDRRRGRS